MGLVGSKINETENKNLDELKFPNLPKNHTIFLRPIGPLGILLKSPSSRKL